MARTPIPEVDSSAAAIVGPLRESFLRHLAAENRSTSTRITYAAAIDLWRPSRPPPACPS